METLKSYMDKSSIETIQIDNMNHKTTYGAIKKGYWTTRFIESLIKKSNKRFLSANKESLEIYPLG